jgi:hypothetical protein
VLLVKNTEIRDAYAEARLLIGDFRKSAKYTIELYPEGIGSIEVESTGANIIKYYEDG